MLNTALMTAVMATMLESRPAVTPARLRAALAGDLDPDQRFDTALLLAGVLTQRLRVADAADVLEQQLDAFATRPDLHRAAEAALVRVTRIDPATRPRTAELVERVRARVEQDEECDGALLATVAAELAMAGAPADRTARVAERAVHAAVHGWSWYDAVHALIVSERYDEARHQLAASPAADALRLRSELHLRVGDLTAAEADARRLHEMATASGRSLAAAGATASLLEVLVERGAIEEAAALVPVYPTERVLLARAKLRLAQGRLDDAIEDLRECGRRALAVGTASPAALPWRSLLAHALVERGATAEARRLAADELKRARRCGTPRAIGIALRAAARAAGGDDEIALLREAVTVLDASEAQLELAHAHADLAAALLRAGAEDEARDSLRAALDLAHRCGATTLEERTLTALRATGARPRRRLATGSGALTRSERRIAELAAAGQKNREIADTLVVTMGTVEYHLRHAYRKLGIGSRSELVTALAA